MGLTSAAAEAERVLSIGLAQADQNVTLRSAAGRAEAREILEMLERADQQLERRLQREARRFGPDERFTGAGLLAYRRQVQLVNQFVRARMDRNSRRAARRNIRQGWFDTVGLLGGLERAHSGSVRPLRINTARMMNERTRGVQASLLRQHATSMDRYGEHMEREMRQTLQSNLLAGGSFSQAVDQLVAMRGPRGRVSMAARELGDGRVERMRLERIPEGLFRRYRWWAMRIVRTETAYAQNAASFEALNAARDHDFPDMQKKILAMMDNRTYPDSIAVHGQIRDLDKTFLDGAGREYLHPPARPNDREVVIPWRPAWQETPTSEPRPSLEEAIQRARGERGTETLPEGEVAGLIEDHPPPVPLDARARLLQHVGDPAAFERELATVYADDPRALFNVYRDMTPEFVIGEDEIGEWRSWVDDDLSGFASTLRPRLGMAGRGRRWADLAGRFEVLEGTPTGVGVNASEILRLRLPDGREIRAIWKNESTESMNLRQGIQAGTYHQREQVMAVLDHRLGGDGVVPPTVSRFIEGRGTGSLQLLDEDAADLNTVSDEILRLTRRREFADHPGVRRVAALDIIGANDDRHDGNLMWAHGRPVAIDNGLTLPHPGQGGAERYIFPGITGMTGPRAQSQMEAIMRFADDPALVRRIRGIDLTTFARDMREADIERGAARAALARLRALQRNPNVVHDYLRDQTWRTGEETAYMGEHEDAVRDWLQQNPERILGVDELREIDAALREAGAWERD